MRACFYLVILFLSGCGPPHFELDTQGPGLHDVQVPLDEFWDDVESEVGDRTDQGPTCIVR